MCSSLQTLRLRGGRCIDSLSACNTNLLQTRIPKDLKSTWLHFLVFCFLSGPLIAHCKNPLFKSSCHYIDSFIIKQLDSLFHSSNTLMLFLSLALTLSRSVSHSVSLIHPPTHSHSLSLSRLSPSHSPDLQEDSRTKVGTQITPLVAAWIQHF